MSPLPFHKVLCERKNPWYDGNHFMEKKARIAKALAVAIQDIEAPALKDHTEDLRSLPLSENLDSLGMVNLIIGLEDALKQEFGRDVPLLGRSEGFNTASLKTGGMLIDYIDQIV
jgi:hypothetical protein